MYRRNVDERLRKIERDWLAQGGGVGDYCKYVNELRRASEVPPSDLHAGEAFGRFPAAIHLFAPRRLSDFPRKWLDQAFAGWNVGLSGDKQDRFNDNRKALVKTCLPPSGIISHILQAIQPHLIGLSPRRCTCGGYERGHSPDCEISVGTGDPAEDLYDVIREWTSDLRHPRDANLLDMFLDGGVEAVHQGLTQDEYDLYQVIYIINHRLQTILHLGMDYTDGNFTFLLNVVDASPAPIAGFKVTVSDKNECYMAWSTQLRPRSRAYSDEARPGGFWQTASAERLARDLITAIGDIPGLIQEYPVWNWRAIPDA